MSRQNLFVTEKYIDKETGEEKPIYTLVGSTVPHKKGGGFTHYIRKGLSISGSAVSFPPKEDPSGEEIPIEGELVEG